MRRRSRAHCAFAAVMGLAALANLLAAGQPHDTTARRIAADDVGLTAQTIMFDDFSGPAGSPPDPRWWSYDIGGGGWGNHEVQSYTRAPANVRLDGEGHLVIEARDDGGTYTSARINTKNRVSLAHGRAEARIRLPRGAGLHPAFWLLGTDLDTAGWPVSGEIDVVETIGNANELNTALHGPKVSGGQWQVGTTTAIDPSFVDDFHTYWVQKDPGRITMGVDDLVTADFRAGDLPSDQRWVFDKPFFVVLNTAVGGEWPGPADSTTPSPAVMVVDWVRIASDV